MSSVNKVTLLGRLGRDPEVRHGRDGAKIVHLSLATSERWRDRQSGQPRQRTEWHKVVIFNDVLAGVAEEFLSKGKQVYLEGKLQTHTWTDRSGRGRTITEVVVPSFGGDLRLLGGRDSGDEPVDEESSHPSDGDPVEQDSVAAASP